MPKSIDLILSPSQAADPTTWRSIALRRAGISTQEGVEVRVVRRSVDSRSHTPKVNMTVEVFSEQEPRTTTENFSYPDVSRGEQVVVVGSGPAGLFAALRLIEGGMCPIVIERGRKVAERRADITAIHRGGELNPESNYAFGQGGAGTFSDGKLFTRSKKRGDSERILQALHFHGADASVLYEAHPHIGSDRLPKIIENICNTITSSGGEVIYGARVDSLIINDNKIEGVRCGNDTYRARHVILATGHSASDIYTMLQRQKILLQAKPFAMGVRVEHPQELIDTIQYHDRRWAEYLGAAAYQLVGQVAGRGVYSFCMCPGGVIVPASTSSHECVVNGMSASARASRWANAAVVTEVRVDDFAFLADEWGELAGLRFRELLEQEAFLRAGSSPQAPAQRLTDFVTKRLSADLPRTSYTRGTVESEFGQWLPGFIGESLREGVKLFERKMHGFLTSEAQIIGVESRTSTPVRIPRDPQTLMHPQTEGLYPTGEGAGYAGGIVSAAVDGDNVAQQILNTTHNAKQ